MKIADEEFSTTALDHHGLVAAMCKDLKISDKIDKRLFDNDERRPVSPGKAVLAMIINGLGFSNRRLYLTSQFFENKPVELLLDAEIEAKDLTDHTLGHALDEITDYGSSQLFGELAFEIAQENNLLEQLNHLDTTSFSVHGQYEESKINTDTQTSEADTDTSLIRVTHGHSKDYRPDLKQVVLSLVVNGPSAIPLWMEPLDGNSSDKTSFHESIKNVNEFKKQLNVTEPFKWVADSALYSKEKLLNPDNKSIWLSRVPENSTDSKKLVELPDNEIKWSSYDNGYRVSPYQSNYGDVEQRWLLVYSEQAYKREEKTLEKRITRQTKALTKALWHLEKQMYACEDDAKKALQDLTKKYKYHQISGHAEPVKKYSKPGKPKGGEQKVIIGYQIKGAFDRDKDIITVALNRKGRFILATNDLDKKNYSDKKMLDDYKSQQNVERGFRFLKDPWFMLNSIFLKSPKRIEGLMVVMTLCLLVYNLAQHKIRSTLKDTEDTLPNQLRKPIQNPTMKWIFQLMEGISIVSILDKNIRKPVRELVTNLTDVRRKIIRLFGDTASKIYGLIEKSCGKVL